MNWDGASADTLTVVSALDDAGMFLAAAGRYGMLSIFCGRGRRAMRACRWAGVDGGAAVDWSLIASLLEEIRAGCAARNERS